MLVVAIDPDVEKSGWCIVGIERDNPILTTKTLWEVFKSLNSLMEDHIVIIEAGWLVNKSNWHTYGNKGIGEKASQNVGRNHEIGRQIEKFCIAHEINYRLEKPRGYSDPKRYSHEGFIGITGWKHIKKTNPETRVAGLFAFHEAQRQKMLSKKI